VVLAGPNGTGKSSLFDGFEHWRRVTSSNNWQEFYHLKVGLIQPAWDQIVQVDFHDATPPIREDRRSLFYIRSAYRNEPDFSIEALRRVGPIVDAPGASRMIDNDARVADDYQRLVSATVESIYSGERDDSTVRELRESFIGAVRDALQRLLPDLVLQGPGDPLAQGSFFFNKGTSEGFHYRNLSGGEKAAFDLILDLIVKKRSYEGAIFCIDEPEAHMNTALQGSLLRELVALLPVQSQLWIASHSVGMMNEARQMKEQDPESVAFIDFNGQDFDQPVVLRPVDVTRDF